MTEEELVSYLGSIFNLTVETFLDHEFKKGKIRVRPVSNQKIPSTLHVAFSKRKRESIPVGTKFEIEVRLCKKATGKFYLNPIKNDFFYKKKEKGCFHFEKQLYLPF